MGLIARTIEAAGIPTVTVGSCRDMMASVKPPRGVFLDFPLGRPCGRPGNVLEQRAIVGDVLDFLVSAAQPGELKELPYEWGEPFGWPDFMRGLEEMIKSEGETVQEWKPDP